MWIPPSGDLSGAAIVFDNSLSLGGASQSITVTGTGTQATGVITFPQPPTPVVYVAGETTTLDAANNAGSVAYTVSGPATVNGSTLTYTGSGTVMVTANQGTLENDLYTTPAPVTVTINVLPAGSVAGSYAIPSTPVGSSSAVQTITLEFQTVGTLATPLASAIQVLIQGAPNLDFTYASGGTCAAGASYAVDQTCTVDVIFSPKLAAGAEHTVCACQPTRRRGSGRRG